jgi:hypothetical protein
MPIVRRRAPVCGPAATTTRVAGQRSPGRSRPNGAAAGRLDPADGDVLEDARAVVRRGPGIGLDGALRVGVAAEMQMHAAYVSPASGTSSRTSLASRADQR